MADSSQSLDRERVLAALDHVQDGDRGLVSAGMIDGLVVRDGEVGFALRVDPARGPALEDLRLAAERAVAALPGVRTVRAVLTAERAPGAPAPRPHQHAHSPAPSQPTAPRPAPQPGARASLVPDVRHVIAVASGKGGVGKSTVAVNLAVALARLGLSVGLLDADIYGPSGPRMTGTGGRPEVRDGKRLVPKEAFGLKLMSIGYLVAEETAMIWRGPMVMGAVEQMLRDVEWGALDVLVVDMPPGTGDVQLTLAQRVPMAGAVIVSTPQDIALIDARRGIEMFGKTNVPVLGLIENMSYFCCPNCGHRAEIFGHGGARAEAERIGVPFLGEIPLDIRIRETSDAGTPITASEPDGTHAAAFRAIAEQVRERMSGARREAPRITVE